jgi:hypothetical protein
VSGSDACDLNRALDNIRKNMATIAAGSAVAIALAIGSLEPDADSSGNCSLVCVP